MKKIFLFAVALLSYVFSYAETPYDDMTDIDDLALIYIGSQHRPDWNKDLFTPYVAHTYPDGTKSWMFDGFLMIEFLAYNENGDQVSFGETTSTVRGAKKEDWERLLHEQLGTYNGYGCRALDNLIEDLKPQLGTPGHKHKVVFTLPVAEAKSDIWGVIDGRKYDFANRIDDRTDAMKWYADLLVSEWNKAGFKNLDLEGVYWTNETFYGQATQMAQDVNRYYKEKYGHKIYWIPYLTRYNGTNSSYLPAPNENLVGELTPTQSADNWEELGIDVVYIQPGYYFYTSRPEKNMSQAIDYADKYSLGLEMEFEGYNFGWTPDKDNPANGVRYQATPSNCGLYGISPTFYDRFKYYIDQFEEAEEFDLAPLAYYSGFQAVYDFENSGHPKDKEIINRLANLMNKRHIVSGWDSAPRTTGIDEIAVDDRVLAYGLDGAIYIAREAVETAAIYSLDGKVVYSSGTIAGDNLSYGVTVACEPGVYVVRVGARAIKVAVK